jgi:hypothetical protein
MNDDSRLDNLFQTYRAACPEVEAGANFMPNLWQKIEARHNFWFIFQRFARTAMTACAALCLLLLALNLFSVPQSHLLAPSYADALMADHTAEKTYYTEAIRNVPSTDEAPAALESR